MQDHLHFLAFLKTGPLGTLNVCLKVPKKMQNTVIESNYSRLRKRPKTAQKWQKWIGMGWSD